MTQCPYVAHDLRKIPAIEKQIGSPVRCAVVFSDNMQTWDQWERPWFAYSPQSHLQWEKWVQNSGGRNTLVMTFNMIPKDAPANWRAQGASGAYDAHIKKLAQNLVSRGLGTSVIRLGAEMNGDWRIDQIGDTTAARRDWARYWARTVRVMRTVPGANFIFDWNINGGYRPIPFNEYYPGDDVVDIIGVDQYDSLWQQKTSNRFAEVAGQRGGMYDIATFAKAHNKPLSLPEVGLVDRANRGAGDDPAYVSGVGTYLKNNRVAYIGYFDHNVSGTLRLDQVPRSASRWRASIGNGTALSGLVSAR